MTHAALHHLLLALLLAFASCQPNNFSSPLPEETPQGQAKEAPHEKIRSKPYPRLNDAICVNPCPLLVPQIRKTDKLLQFALSTDSTFEAPSSIVSTPQPWCMFNPHQSLAEGSWYWRFRSVSQTGRTGDWSETLKFEVSPDVPSFLTPSFEQFQQHLPSSYPRLYYFLEEELALARQKVKEHLEYRQLKGRADAALKVNYADWSNPYGSISEMRVHAVCLYQAFLLLSEESYRGKLLEMAQALLRTPISDADLFSSNFFSTDVALVFLKAYDVGQEQLLPAEKQAIEELLLRIARHYYKAYVGYQENHIYDNHFWQKNMRVLFQIAYLLHSEASLAEEMLEMLAYYYELWTARAPDSGFNRDGVALNGASYIAASVKTLYYMPSLFSSISGGNFLLHPWYVHAGRALLYSWLPNSKSTGFGDGSEKGSNPNRLNVALADFLARECDDAYAGWYASQCQDLLHQDYELRLYRMVRQKNYASSALPDNHPKLLWNKDAGEVMMHSAIENPEQNLSLSFRSSPFGSGSHNLADQNSFKLLYRGKEVYGNSGYYIDFSGAHNIMSYRHTRAHNSILVNGIGQPFSMEGYGEIIRAVDGKHVSYCLGDASQAYGGISTDPMWVKAFEAAGLTQTPHNGFGATPLSLFRRHVWLLHPDNIVVLLDELEAKEKVEWDWLLHSPSSFQIDQAAKRVQTSNESEGFKSVTQLFSRQAFEITQTNQFVVPPKPSPLYPNQWHLTARFPQSERNRILTIIQVLPAHQFAHAISRADDTFTCGDWSIEAELNPEEPIAISIAHGTNNIVFSYGATK